MTNSIKTVPSQKALCAARRRVEQRLESLRAVENAPNRGTWDYRTALRSAEARLFEAREALRNLVG